MKYEQEGPGRLVEVSIEIPRAGDTVRLRRACNVLALADRKLGFSAEPGGVTVEGTSEEQLYAAVGHLSSEFGIDIRAHTPRIVYRETFTEAADVDYREQEHVSGLRIRMRLEPNERGKGNTLQDRTTIRTGRYAPAVRKAVSDVWARGLFGYPMIDTKVTLQGLELTETAILPGAVKVATWHAMRQGALMARVKLLEPIMALRLTAPFGAVAGVTGDLERRGATLVAHVADASGVRLHATAPLSRLLGYGRLLAILTQGKGTVEMTFSHFADARVPRPIAGQ